MAFKAILAWCSACLILTYSAQSQSLEDLTVTLNGGSVVRGKRETAIDKQVEVFLGIPYGKAPVGEKRFRPSEPIDGWDGILDTVEYGNACYGWVDEFYGDFFGSTMWNPKQPLSEDCLNLNVWTPSPRPTNAVVMVWIYGGGFYSGTSGLSVYDGKFLAAMENVIVVSFNYRLGPLGFLYSGRNAPGNAGLLDQVLALQWVQNNIDHFGGDPSRVTIFGESAGSDSVGYHLLSPLSRNLFQYAILQSGTPNNPWGFITHELALDRTKRLAGVVGCNNFDNDQMMTCLRDVDPRELVLNQWVDYGPYVFPFVPVLDGTFLVEPPQTSLERHSFKNTSILIGNNLNEGYFFLVYGTAGLDKYDNVSTWNHERYRRAIRESFANFNQFGYDAIAFQYVDWLDANDPAMLRAATDAMVGDYNIICSSNNFALAYAEASQTVYKYFFEQVSSNTPWPVWMGCLHGDEIAYVFGIPLNTSTGYSPAEQELSRQMMRYWASFARTGHPVNDESWPVFTESGKHHMTLHTDYLNFPQIDRGARANTCAFWDHYLPNLNVQTADIEEAEKRWKEEFHQWSTKYMGDWKAEFQTYVTYKGQICDANNP
ncbi:cholinesterase-like [Ptychodera flava]|uniref:cholinesterase-like n=1 Tax=Ptychodera flava TaxID=63121 RepID=UPI00396A4D34